MKNEIEKRLADRYLQGFRDAVTGDTTQLEVVGRYPNASYSRGYSHGSAALFLAQDRAKRSAKKAVDDVVGFEVPS